MSALKLAAGALVLAGLAAAAAALGGRAAIPPPSPLPERGMGASRKEAIRSFWDAFRRAEAARLSGSPARLAEAEAGYREALALDPEHEDALWQLANVLVTEGRRGEAIAVLRDHMKSHPRSTRGFARLGDLLSDPSAGPLRDPSEAEAMYRKALSLNPEESGGYINLGRLLYAKGDLEGAGAQFRSALKINFKSLVAARYLALLAIRRGEDGAAAGQLAATLGRFLADKPRLFALSEGDVRESEGAGSLTPSAREVFPAAELLWLLVESGAASKGDLPQGIRDLFASPLPVEPGGRAPAFAVRRGAEAGVDPADRVAALDLDRDGIADRVTAGPTEPAESAAWILTGKVLCGDRAVRAEIGTAEGRFEVLHAGGPPPACLPSGRLRVSDVNGDGVDDLRLEPDGVDPARIEPEIRYLGGGRGWSVSAGAPRLH